MTLAEIYEAMNDWEIKVDGLERTREELGALLSPSAMRSLNREIGINVRERTADHLAKASVSRHTVADRLGARHTKFLEFAPARGQLRGGSAYKGKDAHPFTEVRDIRDDGVTVVIGDTPGLRRAFGALVITPRNKRALTIPLHKVSYAKRVADLREEGHNIFRPKGTNILADTTGKGKRAKLRPLYALVKRTTLRQDRGLLPKEGEIRRWAMDSTEQFIDTLLENM